MTPIVNTLIIILALCWVCWGVSTARQLTRHPDKAMAIYAGFMVAYYMVTHLT